MPTNSDTLTEILTAFEIAIHNSSDYTDSNEAVKQALTTTTNGKEE